MSPLHPLLTLGYMVLKVVVESTKQMCNLQGEDRAVCLNNSFRTSSSPPPSPFSHPCSPSGPIGFSQYSLEVCGEMRMHTDDLDKEGSYTLKGRQYCRQQPSDSKAAEPSSDLGKSLGVLKAGSPLWFSCTNDPCNHRDSTSEGCPEHYRQAIGSKNTT